MSTYLNTQLKEGDIIDVMPPMGKFILEPNSSATNHYFMFGGGSGITPLISIIKTALLTEPNSKCYLFYANRNEESIIFREELDALEENPNLKIFYSLDEPNADWSGHSGYLTENKVSELI